LINIWNEALREDKLTDTALEALPCHKKIPFICKNNAKNKTQRTTIKQARLNIVHKDSAFQALHETIHSFL
jgi:hypothetical protein